MTAPHFDFTQEQNWREERGPRGYRGEVVEIPMTAQQMALRDFIRKGGRLTDWFKAFPPQKRERNGFTYITERFGRDPRERFWEGIEYAKHK